MTCLCLMLFKKEKSDPSKGEQTDLDEFSPCSLADVAGYKKWLAFLVEVQGRRGPLHSMHAFVLAAKVNMHNSIVVNRATQVASKREC